MPTSLSRCMRVCVKQFGAILHLVRAFFILRLGNNVWICDADVTALHSPHFLPCRFQCCSSLFPIWSQLSQFYKFLQNESLCTCHQNTNCQLTESEGMSGERHGLQMAAYCSPPPPPATAQTRHPGLVLFSSYSLSVRMPTTATISAWRAWSGACGGRRASCWR